MHTLRYSFRKQYSIHYFIIIQLRIEIYKAICASFELTSIGKCVKKYKRIHEQKQNQCMYASSEAELNNRSPLMYGLL